MTREEAIFILERDNPNNIAIRTGFESLYDQRKEAFSMAINALEQLPKLQNRCHALTHGLLCVFCPYECEHRAEVEPQESEDK